MANSDFTQKLLNDLRMRKQRMAAAQNSSQSSLVPAGAYENSRKSFKSSGEIRILDMIGSKMGSSMYKGSAGSSQRSLVSPQASNQIIVPYRIAHSSEPTIEFSRALAYAFDPNEVRRSTNKMDFTTGTAFLGFLQQISSSTEWVSMERTRKGSNMRWSSSDRYPILTNLHINEISKGAQKLNQILRACSNGINIDRCSVEIGKELLKGAIDLEESLNMLVKLQEASEYMIGTQTRSQIKLLEEDEDVDENNRSVTENKHVERPVFSFDKHSKKKKGFTLTGMKQNLMALPYSNEEGNVRTPEKQVSLKPGHNSHRRMASSQADFDVSSVVSAPYRLGTSQTKHETGKGSSVIAKLMGLEEPPPEVNELKVKANNQTISNQKLEGLLSTKTVNRSSTSAVLKSEDVKKYTVLGANKKEIQSSKLVVVPAFNSQDTGKHINVANDTKTRWNEEENAKKPKELIFKINELSRYMHQNQTSGSRKGIGDVMKADEQDRRKKADVKKNDLWRTGHATSQSPEAAERLQGERSSTENSHPREKRNASKVSVNVSDQQKKQKDVILHPPHVSPSDQPQGKKQKSEERQQHRVNNNRTQVRQTNASPAQRKKSAKATHELKNLQKSQLPTKQANKGKQTAIEANTTVASLQSPINRKNEKIAGDESSPRSDQKPKDSRMPGSENHTTMTDKETKSRVRKASNSLKNEKIAPKSGIPHKANEVMTKTRTASKTLRLIKHETTILYGMNAKQLEKICKSKGDAVMNISKSQGDAVMNITKSQGAAEMNIGNALPADTSTRAGNEEESAQSINEASQEQIKAENASITYNAKKYDVQHFDEFDTSLPNNKKQPFIAGTDQVHQEPKPQTTALNQAKDVYEDRGEISYNIQEKQKLPPKAEIQEPLTEEEVHLKQTLITSHLFLNTAEAFFKLNIPVTILNATDYAFHKNESKILIDTGYEVMKRKARRQEHCLYSCMKISCKGITVHSLDYLVKQLHRDIDILRHYGRKKKEDNEYEAADYLINMLERDLHSWDPDVNCMWDLEWSELMFAYVETDEVIRDVEKCLLNELLDEATKDIGVKI